MTNKEILLAANKAISEGDHEGFLSYCKEDSLWHFMGDQTLRGKDEIRAYMKETYIKPPLFFVDTLIAENDFVVALGKITLYNTTIPATYDYCDVWKLHDGKLAELKAFVTKIDK